MLTTMRAEITQRGVKIGLHAGSSCWVNLEYFGRFEFLLTAEGSVDPAPPELDVGLEFMGKKGSNVKYSQKKMAEISIKSKKITERMELRGLG